MTPSAFHNALLTVTAAYGEALAEIDAGRTESEQRARLMVDNVRAQHRRVIDLLREMEGDEAVPQSWRDRLRVLLSQEERVDAAGIR